MRREITPSWRSSLADRGGWLAAESWPVVSAAIISEKPSARQDCGWRIWPRGVHLGAENHI